MRHKEPDIHIKKIPPYSYLAPFYDDLMDYIDYDLWIEDIMGFIKEDPTVMNMLDVSCGTGSMAVRFAQAGLKVTAVDISPEMVREAKKKVDAAKLNDWVRVAVGDMRQIPFPDLFDIVINLHDGLNYLPNLESAAEFLEHTYKLIRPDGWLIMDVVTPLLCENHFMGYREIYTDESGGYERETNYDKTTRQALTKFTFEISPSEFLVEEHGQRAYDLEEVRQLCEQSPFDSYEILDDEDFRTADASSERFYVILRRT